LKKENCPERLLTAKFFPGNRPSLSLLFGELNAYTAGQLLAMYEHRTSVEGFLWKINSYDQFGVELGKQLAKNVRGFFKKHNGKNTADFAGYEGFNSATKTLLNHYVQNK